MIDFEKLRKLDNKILVIGSYPIVQAIIDFDFLSGKKSPSIKAILAAERNYEKYFWGKKEILIPVYENIDDIPVKLQKELNLFINLTSGRRSYSSSIEALDKLPSLVGGNILAEEMPEKLAIDLFNKAEEKGVFILGPASVGIILPSELKLGTIAGVRYEQFIENKLFTPGNIAVFASSAGMTNEIISIVNSNGKRISAALAFGGDRFPIVQPMDAFLAAQKDKATDYIVYFGELGGYDEYELIKLIKAKKITKKIVAYIAGVISEAFDKPTQFGHAKALAKHGDESARAKREALRKVGVIVPDSFTDFVGEIKKLKAAKYKEVEVNTSLLEPRVKSIFTTSIVSEPEGEVHILKKNLTGIVQTQSFAKTVISMLLGKNIKSKELEQFTDTVIKLLVDHGPNVSGAVNTMISARAGKDMVSSLVSGLLTIGPRFGGAINEAAKFWIEGVETEVKPAVFVENYARQKIYISGIGHKKYRIDLPDPRVKIILGFTKNLKNKKFSQFALGVQKVTTSKKGNLILNVDGAIAAVLLDLLNEKEGYSIKELKKLAEIEFFNALFIISRTVGFTSHYLDQKRLDEGLFRLDKNLLAEVYLED